MSNGSVDSLTPPQRVSPTATSTPTAAGSGSATSTPTAASSSSSLQGLPQLSMMRESISRRERARNKTLELLEQMTAKEPEKKCLQTSLSPISLEPLPSLAKPGSSSLLSINSTSPEEKLKEKVIVCAEKPKNVRPFRCVFGVKQPQLAEDPEIIDALKAAGNERNPDRSVSDEGLSKSSSALAAIFFTCLYYIYMYI